MPSTLLPPSPTLTSTRFAQRSSNLCDLALHKLVLRDFLRRRLTSGCSHARNLAISVNREPVRKRAKTSSTHAHSLSHFFRLLHKLSTLTHNKLNFSLSKIQPDISSSRYHSTSYLISKKAKRRSTRSSPTHHQTTRRNRLSQCLDQSAASGGHNPSSYANPRCLQDVRALAATCTAS